jgi:hypothetical protein
MKKWFVILKGNGNVPLPLVDLSDDIVLFNSRKEADIAGSKNIIGESFGFIVYSWYL